MSGVPTELPLIKYGYTNLVSYKTLRRLMTTKSGFKRRICQSAAKCGNIDALDFIYREEILHGVLKCKIATSRNIQKIAVRNKQYEVLNWIESTGLHIVYF